MDRLTALRAPLATVALALLTLVAAARVGLGLSEVVTTGGSRAVAAARLAPNAGDAALTVLVAVLVVACFVGPRVPGARRLAVWGTTLALLSLVVTGVALGLAGPAVAGWNLVWSVPDLAVPALVGVALFALARPDAVDATAASASGAGEPAAVEPGPEPAPDPELQPSWEQDAAAGAVWRTAGEAARGAPAQAWGTSEVGTWSSAALPPADPARSPYGPADEGRDKDLRGGAHGGDPTGAPGRPTSS